MSDHSNPSEETVDEEVSLSFIPKLATGIIALVAIIVLACNSVYTLSEGQVAVLQTFGKPEAVTKSGIHFKIPFVQSVYKMSAEILGMKIGYDENNQSVSDESEMITSDYNFVNADFYIECRISDPVQAYIHRDTCEAILKNLALSYIRDTIGTHTVDDVITTGKAEIQNTIREKLALRMEEEDVGLAIVNVLIQDTEPPEQVQSAFKAVEDAKQGMETKVNQANQYNSEQIPAANAKADQAKQDAEAYKQERISEAEGQTARYHEMYAEYIKYPLITKKRMFYETMEDVLPGLKVIINSSDGTQAVLPLDSFVQQEVAE